jgi:uncharacterized membrane protein YjfL (UPF0719 family)
MEIHLWLFNMVKSMAWVIVASVSMSISMWILLTVYNKLTPGIDEMEELKKGNIAVAIVLAAVIISYGIVVGCFIVSP